MRVRSASAIFAIALGCVALLGLWQYTLHSRGILMYDFRAFYCGAGAAIGGHDPYLQEPLYSCESHPDGSWLMNAGGNVAVPAPFPGYVFVLLMPLTLLPFPIASLVWAAVMLLCAALTVLGLRRLTGINTWALSALVFSADCIVPLTLGQLTPLAVMGLVWGAVAVEEGRFVLAAAALAFAAFEPHLTIGAILSLFVWKARSRIPLLVMAFVLAGSSVALLGAAAASEYLRVVLPLHALSELRFPGQLALAPLLYQLGVSARQAVLIAGIQWAIVVAIGVVTARRVAQAYSTDALLLLWPAGVALLGGVFLHAPQIAFIIPLIVLVAARNDATVIARVSLILLSVPWLPTIVQPELLGVGALAMFLVARLIVRLSVMASLATVAGFMVVSLTGFYFVHHTALASWASLPAALHIRPNMLAEITWQAAMSTYNYGDVGTSIGRLLTWAGLVCACFAVGIRTIPEEPRRDLQDRFYSDSSLRFQLVRYLFIGGISAGADVGVFLLLLAVHVPVLIVATVSYGCGLAVHFTLNKYVNFRAHDRPIHHQASTYAAVAFTCWLTTLVIVKAAIFFGFSPVVGKLVAIVVGAPIGFFGHRHFTFGRGLLASVKVAIGKRAPKL